MPLALALSALGASMNVHSIIGHRATQYYGGIANGTAGVPAHHAAAYEAVIRAYPNAVLGGSDFPDFLYACGSYSDHHDAGEAAHWPPFQAAAVRYLQELQPDPTNWNADQQELAAFVFGVAAHYVTDELWEGLTSQLEAVRGFTEMVDAFQLGNAGHGNTAEGVANFAADFYAAWVLDEANISAFSRSFPLHHLVNIYHSTPKSGIFAPDAANFSDVTYSSLLECRTLFDLGLWALQAFGPLLFELYNDGRHHQLPLVAEVLFDAPLSGVDDIAASVGFAWARLAAWLSAPAGPPLAPPPRSVLRIRANAAADDADDRSTYALLGAIRHLDTPRARVRLHSVAPSVARDMVVLERTAPTAVALKYLGPEAQREPIVGLVAALTAHFFPQVALTLPTATDVEEREQEEQEEQKAPPPPRPPLLSSRRRKLAPPAAELAVAPATPAAPVATWSGAQPLALLGSAVASGDFDGDGVPEVALAAEGAGTRAVSPRAGEVRVYRYATSEPGGSGPAGTAVGTTPSVVLRGGGALARFGAALAVLDFNRDGIDDLAVGAPGASGWNLSDTAGSPYPFAGEPTFRSWGRVHVHLGQNGTGLSQARRVELTASTPFLGLGSVLATGDVDADGARDLLLGCPAASGYDGRVLAVAASATRTAGEALNLEAPGVAALDISGPQPRGAGTALGMFGAAVAVAKGGQLLVGEPYHRPNASCTTGCAIVGRVLGLDLADRPRNATAMRFAITGSSALGRLGGALAARADGALALSAPDAPGASGAPRAGVVAIVGAAALRGLHGNVTLTALQSRGDAAVLLGTDAQARLGSSLLWAARGAAPTGEAGAATDAEDQVLVAGAPWYSDGVLAFASRELGAVLAWRAAALPAAGANATAASAGARLVGVGGRGRFGASLGNTGTASLLVGSPRATVASGEQGGAADVVNLDVSFAEAAPEWRRPLHADTRVA